MPATFYPGFGAYLAGEIAKYFEDDLGPRIRDDAVRYAPLGVSTPPTRRWPPHEAGELKASIGHHLEGPRTLIVDATAPYAYVVETGASPRPINAKGPWSLHNAVTDQYFGPHVNWPGFAGRHFLRAALYQERA